MHSLISSSFIICLWGETFGSRTILFSSTRSPFWPKITKFPNFLFKMPKFGKNLQFQSLKISQNPGQEASFVPKIISESNVFVKKSVQQAPKFGANLFYKPPSSALWATHPYPNWSWVPTTPGVESGSPAQVLVNSGALTTIFTNTAWYNLQTNLFFLVCRMSWSGGLLVSSSSGAYVVSCWKTKSTARFMAWMISLLKERSTPWWGGYSLKTWVLSM